MIYILLCIQIRTPGKSVWVKNIFPFYNSSSPQSFLIASYLHIEYRNTCLLNQGYRRASLILCCFEGVEEPSSRKPIKRKVYYSHHGPHYDWHNIMDGNHDFYSLGRAVKISSIYLQIRDNNLSKIVLDRRHFWRGIISVSITIPC